MTNGPLDTSLLDKAILFAVRAHAGTERRGKGFPYIVHPMEAVSIVASITSDPELLAAAVLHDTVEDTDVTLAQLEETFGSRIASLVEAETDSHNETKGEANTWRKRKQAGIERLAKAEYDVKVVAIGDKLSNMRAIASDYRQMGDRLWERFHAPNGKSDHAWRYRQLVDCLSDLADTEAYQEFVRLTDEVFGSRADKPASTPLTHQPENK